MCPPSTSTPTTTPSENPTSDFLGSPIEICIASASHLHSIRALLRLGIGPWRVFTFTPENTANQTYRGKPARFSLKVAFAETPSGMTWEIMQPLTPPLGSSAEGASGGETIIADFLRKHGARASSTGLVHHIAFDCNGIPWPERLAGFKARAFECVMTGSWMGGNQFAFFEGPDGQSPLTFETYEFPADWVWPEADAMYGVADLDKLDADIAALAESESLQVGTSVKLGMKHVLPARTGVAVPLVKDQVIEVINTHGTQVVDFWALIADPAMPTSRFAEYTSMSHTRASTLRLSPVVNDALLTNHRQPILELIKDTSPGIHDTVIPACDPARYRQLGVTGWHASCAENFRNALKTIGLDWEGMLGHGYGVPDPLNLFMNIPVSQEGETKVGALSWGAPVSKPEDFVAFRALRDCVVLMSACPQDLVKVNNMEPTSVEYVVHEAVT